ncbi:hypothetical protein B0H13DRAFT_2299933 [Mycena leptocephala]|nr:hypothetical protein B0H13DRAFT_2299933 [Mycena leptocephala]
MDLAVVTCCDSTCCLLLGGESRRRGGRGVEVVVVEVARARDELGDAERPRGLLVALPHRERGRVSERPHNVVLAPQRCLSRLLHALPPMPPRWNNTDKSGLLANLKPVLPTTDDACYGASPGSGKTSTFWMPLLFQIVVTPLNILEKQNVDSLAKVGISGITITAETATAENF